MNNKDVRIGAVVINLSPDSVYKGSLGRIIGLKNDNFFVRYENAHCSYPKIIGYSKSDLKDFSLNKEPSFSFMELRDRVNPQLKDVKRGTLLYRNNHRNSYYHNTVGEISSVDPCGFSVKYWIEESCNYHNNDLKNFFLLTEDDLHEAGIFNHPSLIQDGDTVREVGVLDNKSLFLPYEGIISINSGPQQTFIVTKADGKSSPEYPLWTLYKLFELVPKQDKTNQLREQKIMSDNKDTTSPASDVTRSAGVLLKQDAIDATYRVTAKQMSKAVRLGLISLLEKKGMEKSKLDILNEVLSSDAGLAATSELLGWGLEYLPIDRIQQSEQAKLLAKEFRVEGLAVGGNLLLDALRDSLLPTVLEQLDKLPRPEKVRIEEPKENKVRLTSPEEVEAIEEAEQNTSKAEPR